MSAHVEPVASDTTTQQGGKGAIASFFETLVGTVMVILMGVGLVTLTLSWRTSDVEFKSEGELQVTQSTWWGLQKQVTHIHAAVPDGRQEKGSENISVWIAPSLTHGNVL